MVWATLWRKGCAMGSANWRRATGRGLWEATRCIRAACMRSVSFRTPVIGARRRGDGWNSPFLWRSIKPRWHGGNVMTSESRTDTKRYRIYEGSKGYSFYDIRDGKWVQDGGILKRMTSYRDALTFLHQLNSARHGEEPALPKEFFDGAEQRRVHEPRYSRYETVYTLGMLVPVVFPFVNPYSHALQGRHRWSIVGL